MFKIDFLTALSKFCANRLMSVRCQTDRSEIFYIISENCDQRSTYDLTGGSKPPKLKNFQLFRKTSRNMIQNHFHGMRRTFSNFLGKSLSDSTTSERKNTKARGARQRVITIKTRLSASQCEKFLFNFFFLFAQRNISEQDKQNETSISQKLQLCS